MGMERRRAGRRRLETRVTVRTPARLPQGYSRWGPLRRFASEAWIRSVDGSEMECEAGYRNCFDDGERRLLLGLTVGASILSEVNCRLESRMREIRPSGSAGGGTGLTGPSYPDHGGNAVRWAGATRGKCGPLG